MVVMIARPPLASARSDSTSCSAVVLSSPLRASHRRSHSHAFLASCSDKVVRHACFTRQTGVAIYKLQLPLSKPHHLNS